VPVVGTAAGGVAGGASGGAAGAAGGDYAAQRYEMARGLRRKYSGAQTFTEAVLGAIPGGKFAKGASVLRQAGKEAAKGAVLSGGASIAQSELEGRGLPEFKDVATATVMGGIIGGSMGAGIQKFKNRPVMRVPKPGAVPSGLDDLPLVPVPDGEAEVVGTSYVTLGGKKFKMAPVASHGAPTTTFVNRDAVPSQFHEFNQYFGSHVVGEAKTALESGDEVFFRAGPGGKNRVRIVSVADGLLTDASGQKWSTDLMVADPAQGLEVVSRRARPVADSVSSNVAKTGVAAHEASKEAPISSPITPVKPVASNQKVAGTPSVTFLNREVVPAESKHDMGLFGEHIVSKVQAALDNGDEVVLLTDGGRKRVPIVKIDNGMMADASGQRWGSAWMMADPKEGVEIRPSRTVASAPAVADKLADLPAASVGTPEPREPWHMTRQEFQDNYVTHGTTSDAAEKIQKSGISSGFASSPVPEVTYNGRITPRAIAHKFGDKILVFDASAINKRSDQFILKKGSRPRFVLNAGEPEHLQVVRQALERGDHVPEHVMAEYPSLAGTKAIAKEEPVVSSRTLPADEDIDMHEFGNLGEQQVEIPDVSAPVPKKFMDNPRAVRSEVRRIIMELGTRGEDSMPLDTGTGEHNVVNQGGWVESSGSSMSYESNPLFPNLKRVTPNAPVFHDLKHSRVKKGKGGKASSGSFRTGQQMINAGTRYIEGKGNPTPIAEDIVILARKRLLDDRRIKRFPGLQPSPLPEDAGQVAEDFASDRPDSEFRLPHDTEVPEIFASTEQLTGEATPNINAEMPGSPVPRRSGGGGDGSGGGKPPRWWRS
jgi:hypothetical protein